MKLGDEVGIEGTKRKNVKLEKHISSHFLTVTFIFVTKMKLFG